MAIAIADSVRMLVNYARVNEIQAYLQSEHILLRFAQIVEDRQLTVLKARDLQEVMQELGYGIPHYLETIHNWSSRYQAAARPWDATRQDDQPHPVVRRYAETGFGGKGRLLEIGCGSGANARYLSSRGLRVLAIDVARPAIDASTARAMKEDSPCEFACSNIFELKAEASSFDAVLDCWCFHHIPAHLTAAYAAEVARALRPNGQFLLLCHSPHSAVPLALTYGLSGTWAKVIAYLVDATTESVLSRDEIRDVFAPHFVMGPIELHHDVHIRFKGHYSFIVLMKRKS